jgi:hypothetical protein
MPVPDSPSEVAGIECDRLRVQRADLTASGKPHLSLLPQSDQHCDAGHRVRGNGPPYGRSADMIFAVLYELPDTLGSSLSILTAIPTGTLYPLLGRLTQLGWLERRPETPHRGFSAPRNLYRITDKARRYLESNLTHVETHLG